MCEGEIRSSDNVLSVLPTRGASSPVIGLDLDQRQGLGFGSVLGFGKETGPENGRNRLT
jgi:hypothetical protein